ncbi:MAG: PASTA domain-containing protein [Clostridia bacterium]|nr:PASTA domain-containing protein [Clostridia bacterium]
MINTENLCMGCMNDNGGEEICSICGHDSSIQNHIEALPIKFMINNRYIVGKTLKVNGEGITYIGWDKATDSIVKIKEYFPLGIAVRNPDTSVAIAEDKKYVFNEGLLEFLEINRNIMKQSLSSLVCVNDVFEWSGTAYAVLENVQGITLRDFLDRNGGILKWEQARALMLPLIDTIGAMNGMGIVHKGISPETILVGRDGKLRITDYSINKLRIAGTDIESQLFDGYAAIEQYGIYDMQIGQHTDVYGFCATLFNVLIGTEIPKATLRIEDQSLSIPAKFAEELPRHVLAALANGLKVKPQERTGDIEILKNELVYGEIVEKEVKSTAKTAPQEEGKTKKQKAAAKSNAKYVLISALATVLVFAVVGAILVFTVFKDDIFGNESKVVDSSSLDSAPVVDEIGSVDSDAAESVKLYAVPDFSGKTYAEIMEDEENKTFEISIANKVYSDEFAKGKVCKQSVEKGKEVEKNTKIELTISLGAKEFKMPNVVGLDEQTAKLELLKAGFLYENIEVLEKYDEKSEPGVILTQTPEHSNQVNADIVVKIYKNTYEGEEPMGGGDDDEILAGIKENTP